MHELTVTADITALPSIADTAQLRRHRSYGSYRKNVCLFTLNNAGNGWSFWSILNGFGGF